MPEMACINRARKPSPLGPTAEILRSAAAPSDLVSTILPFYRGGRMTSGVDICKLLRR
jgi:hypothetical protein